MPPEIWIICLLLFIRSTATENREENEVPREKASLNSTGIEDESFDGNDTLTGSNETEMAVTPVSEGASGPPESTGSTNATDVEAIQTPGVTSTTPTSPTSTQEVTKTSPDAGTSTSTTIKASTTKSTTESPTSDARTTKRSRTKKPRTKPSRPPQPDDNEEYGVYIDSRNCKHNVLATGGNLYTATCQAKCGREYYNARDGTPCLHKLRRSRRINGKKMFCTMGSCQHGKCLPPYIGEVSCKAPKGTIQYYDDAGNGGHGEHYDDYYYHDSPGYYNNYPDTYNDDYPSYYNQYYGYAGKRDHRHYSDHREK